jgi:hypothetical protein
MKLAAVIALLVGSATAFAPAKVGKSSLLSSSTSALFSYANELGAMKPTGFWDPAGLSKNIDKATFDTYRLAEVKHGRVAMLAVLGYIVPEVYRFPGDIAPGLAFADIPNGVAAINAVPALGWMQIFFLVGAVDYNGFLGDFDTGKPKLSATEMEKRQTAEIAHSRLAMLATMELLRHDSQNFVTPGFDGLDNLITGLPFLYG